MTGRPGAAAGRLGSALALPAGLLHTAAFAPVDAWWLQILALATLAYLVHHAPNARVAALRGWAFGFAGLASGLWWLYISMHQFGNLPGWLAALAVAALAALLALYPAIALGLAWRGLRPGTPAWQAAAVFSGAWLAAELARGAWFTGFPWIASGYAHTDGPLAAWAPWVGVYGITALAALCAAALAWRQVLPLAVAAALLALGAVLPQGFTQPAGTLGVSLLQTAVAQDLKFDAQHMQATMDRLAELAAAAPGPLVVTPESALPLPQGLLDPAYWARLEQDAARPGRALLLGVFLGDEARGYVNSVVGLSARPPAQDFYRYGKRHLLPFGEFIPPGFGWLVRLMNIPIGDQERGDSLAPFVAGGQRLRPLVCYEDLFGEDIAASVVGEGAATLLVNVSNLAWFGPLMVQDQHLQFSRMRALEFERAVVRSTNTGATAVVDHRGAVTARLAPLREGRLDAVVEGRRGSTPYARWLAVAGLWPLWAVALALLGLAWRGTSAPRP